MELGDKLSELARTMTPAERACFKVLLGTAAAELMREGLVPEEGVKARALATSVASIKCMQPHWHRVPQNGVVYRGRPEFVTDSLLSDLKAESDALRDSAVRFHDHLVVSGAPRAREVGFSPELGNLLSSLAGPVQPTSKANYLYYDEPGLGIDPHVDNEEFSLNAILMLRHDYVADPSALVLFPLRSPSEKVYLRPGEMIVMFADSIVHARERVAVNERVSIVAFGFSPAP